MKHTMKMMLGLAAAMMMITNVAAAEVKKIEPAVVMIVDANFVMANSKAIEAVRDRLGQVKDKYRDEISKKETNLKSLEQELTKQRSTLSKDAFEKKRRDFENKVTAFRNETQEKKQKLDTAMNEVLEKVQDKLAVIISNIAETHGANMVMRKDFVMLAKPDMDKTKEVLERLNKELPSVKVTIPN